MTEPREIVRTGYDAIADRYTEWAESIASPETQWIERFLDQLDRGSRVLDLGCGGGRASAQTVAKRHRYTGVDLSPVQVDRARERIPHARFLVGDATTVEFEPGSFDGLMSLFMLGHIPRDEQAPLLARMNGWLRPGGWLLAAVPTGEIDDEVASDWLGAPMFFASFDTDSNRRLLRDAGFEIEREEVIAQDEGEHGFVNFMWVLAASS
jgi:SAM-dependent methyltransferase